MQILAGFTGMVTTLIHYGFTLLKITRLAFHFKIDFSITFMVINPYWRRSVC